MSKVDEQKVLPRRKVKLKKPLIQRGVERLAGSEVELTEEQIARLKRDGYIAE